MGFAIDDWEVSFLTPHDQFQNWAGGVTVEDAGNGLNRVTFTPADWNDTIPANGEISISFNAQGEGLPDSGSLTNGNFFAPAQALMTMDMDMDMDMDMGMSALASDVITGQSMESINLLAPVTRVATSGWCGSRIPHAPGAASRIPGYGCS